MKVLLLSLSLFASFAMADGYSTITPLGIPPALIGIGQSGRLACAPVGFRSDDSVYGACHTVTSAPCSGRGCQPVVYTTNYIVTWDLAGNPALGDACAIVRTHLPQAPQTTYYNGHSAADCFSVVTNPSGTTVAITYGPGDVTYYYYVSTSADGRYELVYSAIVAF
jgi:hypothetical protein